MHRDPSPAVLGLAILTAFTLAESLVAEQPFLTLSGRSYTAQY